MSHGPKLSVHHNELTRKEKQEIKELMEFAEYGNKEERICVAEYLNEQLSVMDGHLFGFWNHRPGQEVEEYDDLIEYFKIYARIICQLKVCTATLTADYKDYRWLYDTDKEWEIEEDSANDMRDWRDKLELRKKIDEGEKAKQKLDEEESKDGN